MPTSTRRPPDADPRFSLAPPPIDVFWLFLYMGLIVACIITLATRPDLRGPSFIALVVTLGLMPIGLRSVSGRRSDAPNEEISRLAAAMEIMNRESGLSEAAKRVLHRREEREILRREIERDIMDGDYDAAMVLVKELAERFGYRADAEEFRARIERSRAETLDRSVAGAINGLELLVREKRWTDAYAEAGRITRLFPESPRVENLRQKVDEARQRYKTELERLFLMAAQRDEIDHAMTLLKELDAYLTEEEAAPLREVARGVIGKARDNLGVRFKLAVQDRSWATAIDVGERIIADFPNTRMADEVRGVIDSLRTRATQPPASMAGTR